MVRGGMGSSEFMNGSDCISLLSSDREDIVLLESPGPKKAKKCFVETATEKILVPEATKKDFDGAAREIVLNRLFELRETVEKEFVQEKCILFTDRMEERCQITVGIEDERSVLFFVHFREFKEKISNNGREIARYVRGTFLDEDERRRVFFVIAGRREYMNGRNKAQKLTKETMGQEEEETFKAAHTSFLFAEKSLGSVRFLFVGSPEEEKLIVVNLLRGILKDRPSRESLLVPEVPKAAAGEEWGTMLEKIPGVSRSVSRRIEERFPSPASIFDAIECGLFERTLRDIEKEGGQKIGEAVVRRIVSYFKADCGEERV
ncbi:MAG: uncharacterized protein A8A55_1135 [Amphiamblys sp. WSBS2006]|nr:MAG: uncharacterized protein A8A55_1135 [Amphiamblys sp. WSBS2006]